MRKHKNTFIVFIGLPLGIITGFLFLHILRLAPLPITSPIYQALNIKKPQIIGFLPYWQLDKTSPDYQKSITTLTYFGLTLDTDGRILQLTNPQEEEPGWNTLRSEKLAKHLQKARHANMTLSLLIHNSNEASIGALLESPIEHAQNLITDVTPIMQKYAFTDLNLDVESFVEASPEAQQKFTQFASEVKKGIVEQKIGTLTVEISPTALVKRFSIDPLAVARIADHIVLMAYDFHYSGSYVTGPVAPLGGVPQVREFDVLTSINEAKKIIPAEKLILGIPLYGYEWETINNNAGAPAIAGSASTASNRRVTQLISACTNCQYSFDDIIQSPRLIFPDESNNFFHQIYFEDEKSLTNKLQLASQEKLSGVALWALGYEGEKILEPLTKYRRPVLN